MEDRLAKILSYILHPLLIPTYAALIMLNLPLFMTYTLSMEAKIWLVILVSGFTCVMPALVVISLYYFHMVKSIELEEAGERTLPLLLTSVSYYALLYLLRSSGLPAYFLYFIYGALFTSLVGLLVSLVYKISLHAMGWGAAIAAFTGISLTMGVDIPLVIILSILLAGVAGYCRLKLNAHNTTQVYLGFATGAGIMVILIILAA